MESQIDLDREGPFDDAKPDRNWIPLVIAGLIVGAVVLAGLLLSGRPRNPSVTSSTAPQDAYAPNLVISKVAMSESASLSGGKITYIDGHISNIGQKTVTGITTQVLFRSYTHEVAQNETMPLRFIRMRDPYIDTQSVAAAPLRGGAEQDFRLIFDKVSPEWAGALPEIRILHVDLK